MTGQELLGLFSKAHRRSHVIGTSENGIIAALDLEGRLFAVVNGRVLNRVVPSAIVNRSNKHAYLNPGGDALWPAPEGTCFGYEYGTGKWRVPPEITGAVWDVAEQSENHSVIRSEIDLVNNHQLGIPCEFERHIKVEQSKNSLIQKVTETIRYIGVKTLRKGEFLLAPWSLCQFDVGIGSKVIMLPPSAGDIWDMYESSQSQRGISEGKYIVKAETDFRFQLGLGENVPWIEYINGNDFRVKRHAGILPPGQIYIDIADAPPEQLPTNNGVKLSIYCDPSGFMEIEACGGCPDILEPCTEISATITTEYITVADERF
ncbi:MAG: hypothetical protein LLG13_04460 [Bacteroidales bacterium]|nr:hypothetical protein [Bacteroidales bacterium]